MTPKSLTSSRSSTIQRQVRPQLQICVSFASTCSCTLRDGPGYCRCHWLLLIIAVLSRQCLLDVGKLTIGETAAALCALTPAPVDVGVQAEAAVVVRNDRRRTAARYHTLHCPQSCILLDGSTPGTLSVGLVGWLERQVAHGNMVKDDLNLEYSQFWVAA